MESKSLVEVWRIINNKLQEKKEPYKDMEGIYEFHMLDQPEIIYQLEFQQGDAFIRAASDKEAGCVLKMKEKYFKQFLAGKLNSTMAFMTGKLKVDGNIGLALKLESMLKQYNFSN